MSIQVIISLAIIGVLSGVLSGFVGVGGGIIIVPGLVFLMGMSQHMAQGTSLFILLLPIGFLAVYNYWKADQINWAYGAIIALTFVVGSYYGSKMALKLSPGLVKLIFGIIMVVISAKLMHSGYTTYSNER
jgi:uncharacterized membrane protein YfcA